MNTSEVLWDHIEHHDLCPGARTLEDWLGVRWLRIKLGRFSVPFLPMWGLRNALVMHDIHHVMTGYGTDLLGEVELAAWEIASGGCGWNLPFWLDRSLVLLVATAMVPWRVIPAWRRGLGCRNLFLQRRAEVLEREFDELKSFVDRG